MLTSPFKSNDNDISGGQSKTHSIPISKHKVDYSLNKEKSVYKKVRACEREHMIVTEYKTGNIVMTVQGGLYEFLKGSLQKLYSNHPQSHKKVECKQILEQSNNYETACTYTVFENDQKTYVVNLYHTRSRIVVNGKRELNFLNDDIPLLYKVLESLQDTYGQNVISDLNALIKRTLYTINKDTVEDQPDNGKCPCVVCKKNVRTNAVQCHTCHQWVHYNCDKMTPSTIRLVSEPDNIYLYRCNTCQKAITDPGQIITHENSHISTEDHETAETINDTIHELVSSIVSDDENESEPEGVEPFTRSPQASKSDHVVPIIDQPKLSINFIGKITQNNDSETEQPKTSIDPSETTPQNRKSISEINPGPTTNDKKLQTAKDSTTDTNSDPNTNTYRNKSDPDVNNDHNDKNNTSNNTNANSYTNEKHIIPTITEIIRSLDDSMCKIAEHITQSQEPKGVETEISVLKKIDTNLAELLSSEQPRNNDPEITLLTSIDSKLSLLVNSMNDMKNCLCNKPPAEKQKNTENAIEERVALIELRLALIEQGNTMSSRAEDKQDSAMTKTKSEKELQQNNVIFRTKEHEEPDKNSQNHTTQSKANEKCKVKTSNVNNKTEPLNNGTNANSHRSNTNINQNVNNPDNMENIRKFKGKDDPLSNLYMGQYKIKVDDVYYIGSEQYYQSECAKHHRMYDLKEKIDRSNSTIHIFNISKKIKASKEWNQKRKTVMKKAIMQKYLYVPEFRDALKDSGNARIVENTYDPYWGGLGGGLNTMGKLLMEIRDNPPALPATPLERVPNEKVQSVLCLVDSNGYNIDYRRTLPMYHTKVRKCPTIEGAIETVRDEEGPEPQFVLIHTGTNNLINDETPAELYLELVSEIKNKWSNTKIIVSKLLPRGGTKVTKKLRVFNNTIENQLLFNADVELIDHSDLLWGENPNHNFYVQEQKAGRNMPLLHLNNAGLANLASKFRYILKRLQFN